MGTQPSCRSRPAVPGTNNTLAGKHCQHCFVLSAYPIDMATAGWRSSGITLLFEEEGYEASQSYGAVRDRPRVDLDHPAHDDWSRTRRRRGRAQSTVQAAMRCIQYR